MGPELATALIGPVLGGVISLVLWLNKRNTSQIDLGFEKIHSSVGSIVVKVEQIDDKVENLKVDVAKNYVTKEHLDNIIESERDHQRRTERSLEELREDIKENREKVIGSNNELRKDINDIKEMQWKTRMSMADLADRSSKRGSKRNNKKDVNTEE